MNPPKLRGSYLDSSGSLIRLILLRLVLVPGFLIKLMLVLLLLLIFRFVFIVILLLLVVIPRVQGNPLWVYLPSGAELQELFVLGKEPRDIEIHRRRLVDP